VEKIPNRLEILLKLKYFEGIHRLVSNSAIEGLKNNFGFKKSPPTFTAC
jgi:hypothetical protein